MAAARAEGHASGQGRDAREHDVKVSYLADVDLDHAEFGDLYDELPLWSAPFGLLLLDRIPIRPGLVVLDVGAGTGFLTVELAQRCGPTSRVIAVDPWKTAMDRLRRKVAYLGLGNVVLLEQDAAVIDLPDESIDLVVSNVGVNNFENADAVLRNCFRVVKPDGRLFLTTNLVGHMAEFYEVFRATLFELGQVKALPALDAHVRRRATVDSLRGLLAQTGFETVDVVRDSFQMRFADGSSLLRHHFIRLGFVPGWKSVVEPDRLMETFEALEHNLNAVAAERGELALTIPMACIEARRETASRP
jgi:arsenite methyltransferase